MNGGGGRDCRGHRPTEANNKHILDRRKDKPHLVDRGEGRQKGGKKRGREGKTGEGRGKEPDGIYG